MGKLLGLIVSIASAFCVATVIAVSILLVYYSKTWNMNRDRLLKAIAIAQGTSPETIFERSQKEREETATEQASLSQIIEARALKARDMELREQALRSGVQMLQTEEHTLADEKNHLQLVQSEFKGKLDEMQQGAKEAGREQARATLESMKPEQAKEQIALMLKKNEMDEVVMLLSAMSQGKRAKILAEFTTDEEADQVSEILRRVRQGDPTATEADKAKKKLEPPKGQGT